MLMLMFSITFTAAESAVASARLEATMVDRLLLASAVSEALVKNRNEVEPLLGAAYYNNEKKRVEPNLLDAALLERVGARDVGGRVVVGLYTRTRHEPGKKYFFRMSGNVCLSMERFVVVRGVVDEKVVLGVEVCEK